MKFRRRRWMRMAALGIGLLPLLATGPCLSIAQESVITGFFRAVTPLLVERLEDHLGVRESGSGEPT